MKVKVFWATLLLLFVNAASLFAQGEICGDSADPDLTCPIDAWVPLLVIAAVIFVTLHLYRKQKITA